MRHDAAGEGGTGSGAIEESQASAALEPARALTDHLMEEVCQRDNLNRAYCRVKANQGAPGIDGLTVDELLPWLAGHKQELSWFSVIWKNRFVELATGAPHVEAAGIVSMFGGGATGSSSRFRCVTGNVGSGMFSRWHRSMAAS